MNKTGIKATGTVCCPIMLGTPRANVGCIRERCALYSDDWSSCSLNSDVIHNAVRTAIVDAAVEIIRSYREEDRR